MVAIRYGDAVVRCCGGHFANGRSALEDICFTDDECLAFAVEEQRNIALVIDEMRGFFATEFDIELFRSVNFDIAMVAMITEGNTA
jgi:hypothetical protein